nr:hypothetical protein [Tanacetum cinerariifolium]
MALLLAHERFSEIKQAFREEQHQPWIIQELLRKLLNDLQVLNRILPKQGEHAAQISILNWKCPVFYDDDDDEYSIQYREYLENSSNESNEFIKSSVEDLVSIPSESEDTSGSDSECILPSCDDFSPFM